MEITTLLSIIGALTHTILSQEVAEEYNSYPTPYITNELISSPEKRLEVEYHQYERYLHSERYRRAIADGKSLEEVDNDEMKLISYLLDENRYNKDVRPVRNKKDAVQVSLDVAYTQLVDLDEKNQVKNFVRKIFVNFVQFFRLLH